MIQRQETKYAYFAIGKIDNWHFTGYAFKARYLEIEQKILKPMEDVPIYIVATIYDIIIARTQDRSTSIVIIPDATKIWECDLSDQTIDYGKSYLLASVEEKYGVKDFVKTKAISEIYKVSDEMYVIVDVKKNVYPVIGHTRK